MSENFESDKPTTPLPADSAGSQATTGQIPPADAAAGGAGGQQPPGGWPPPGHSGSGQWSNPWPGGHWQGGPPWQGGHWQGGHWQGGHWQGTPAWANPAVAPRRHNRYLRPLGVTALVLATVGASIGITHAAWPGGSASTPAASSSGGINPFSGSTNPFSGGSGSSNGGYGSYGNSGNSSSDSSGPSDVNSIASKVDPALVDINVTFDGQNPGAGTGIVLTSNGEILTNNHVVEGATSIKVTDLGNNKTYQAIVVGYDSTDDVAVLQLTNASGLKTASIGDSSKVGVGDDVVAIGNAGGTGGRPSAAGGTVTGLNEAIPAVDDVTGTTENLSGLIETNANIEPGDSGGSLVNSSGQVIGMDTAAANATALSSATTAGYAIPINKALSIAKQIESGSGSSKVHVGPTAYLGVYVSSSSSSSGGFNPSGGQYFGRGSSYGSPYSGGTHDPFGTGPSRSGSSNSSTTSGAAIAGVVSGGPAAKAGLGQGDVITSIDGQRVTSASDLSTMMEGFKPGNTVKVGWTDSSGTAHTSTVTLGTGPAQ